MRAREEEEEEDVPNRCVCLCEEMAEEEEKKKYGMGWRKKEEEGPPSWLPTAIFHLRLLSFFSFGVSLEKNRQMEEARVEPKKKRRRSRVRMSRRRIP